MGLIIEIEKRLESQKDCGEGNYDNHMQLWNNIKQIISDNAHHLDQVTAQLHNYDIHDKTHCDKVLENMELILGSKIENLSFYELVLLYLSANLHDCAMALPSWEYKLISSVEGTQEIFDPKNTLRINNDLQPVKTLKETLEFVKQHKSDIYNGFDEVKHFIFTIKEENDFQLDLSKRVIEYESFRNKYATELKQRIKNVPEYLNYSELLRAEFIRSTHHLRAASYIEALKNRFSENIGNAIATQLILCLSTICRSHGENDEYVFSLEYNKRIGEEYVNVQFLAIILRLADAIHFSCDRAPLSLYSEKLISDPISMQHWNAKFQNLTYQIALEKGTIEIQFSAFCENPKVYYFIHRYINWVDHELNNYHRHIKKLQMIRFPSVEIYNLPLAIQVDRSNILANTDKFMPAPDLKFTLEQDKILNLLMGVQLYKDKYLCLRELYQNSLDACRCMEAENTIASVSEQFHIRFGILSKEIDGLDYKILYCLDNGTGMTLDIIKNHLLRIGNSYYRSKLFSQQNINWLNKVKPTSQFGIGILSCYMIADKIEIVTRHYSHPSEVLCLNMDGICENSYYIPPDEIEVEMVGRHGTLVKLYLKQEIINEIKNDIPKKLPYVIHGRNNNYFKGDAQIDNFKRSLYYLVNRQVGIVPDNIDVEIVTAQDMYEKIIPWNEIFDFRKCSDVTQEDIEALWCEYHYLNGADNPYKEVVKCRDYIEDIPLMLINESVKIFTHISLPLLNIPTDDVRVFDFHKYIWNSEDQILVDGIRVSDSKRQLSNFPYDGILKECLVNYDGQEKPVLSIDRSTIVSMSDELKMQTKSLIDKLPEKLVNAMLMHLDKHCISVDSKEAKLCIDSIIHQFPSLSTKFIFELSKTKASGITFNGILNSTTNNTINDLIQKKDLSFDDFDMRKFSEMERELIVGKLIPSKSIEIYDTNVKIETDDFYPLSSEEKHILTSDSLALSSAIVRADKWDGIYREYDLVSSLWPIVSPVLFDHCKCEHDINNIVQGRSKTIFHCGNSLSGIAQLDPVMINSTNGIFSAERDLFRKKAGYVGERGTLQDAYWLFEMNNHGELVRKEKKDYVLFAFISPRDLNEYEQQRLLDYEDNDDYVKGITEGWSILFVGHEQKYYIKSGKATRDELYALIPNSVRNNKLDNVTYYDTSDKVVF
jgi:molecular chaperone HtpG